MSPAGRHLRVVSANLFNGRVDPDWLCELVAGLHADVVAVQEADARHYEALSDLLPHGAFHEGAASTGMGLSLRHPVTETRSIPLPWRPAPWMRLETLAWPGLTRSLDIVGLHIAAPHVYWPPGYGFWLRRKQVQMLESHFADWFGDGSLSESDRPLSKSGGSLSNSGAETHDRTLLIGDFNATPMWPVYQRMAGHLTDAAVIAGQRRGRPVEPTWSALRRGRRMLRIDHAFTRGVDVQDVQVVDLQGSDHSALVVDLVP